MGDSLWLLKTSTKTELQAGVESMEYELILIYRGEK